MFAVFWGGLGGAAQAQTLVTRVELAQWSGTVWVQPNGTFSHCAVSRSFRAEMLTFSLTPTVFSFGVTRQDRPPFFDPDADADAEDLPRSRGRTRAAVDALWSERLEGERIDANTIVFDLAPWTNAAGAGASPAIQALRTGRSLTLSGGRRQSYPLDDAKLALDWLIACRLSADAP